MKILDELTKGTRFTLIDDYESNDNVFTKYNTDGDHVICLLGNAVFHFPADSTVMEIL